MKLTMIDKTTGEEEIILNNSETIDIPKNISEQKFKRGNLVKLLKGHVIYRMNPNGKDEEIELDKDTGRLAIIEGSYADLYWGENRKDYSVIFLDTGSSVSWKHESELEFIEEGGEHLFKQAKENREKILKRNTDLKWIKNNINNNYKDGLSSDTVLYLFDKIGFDSSFNRNGEYFILWGNWEERQGIFESLFKGNKEDMETEIERFYKSQYQEQYLNSFNKLFDEVFNL